MSTQNQIDPNVQQAEYKIKEAEALLLFVDSVFGEVKQPLTVLLGLSDMLLANVAQDDPIAKDLEIITRQAQRINEIMHGLDVVNNHKGQQI